MGTASNIARPPSGNSTPTATAAATVSSSTPPKGTASVQHKITADTRTIHQPETKSPKTSTAQPWWLKLAETVTNNSMFKKIIEPIISDKHPMRVVFALQTETAEAFAPTFKELGVSPILNKIFHVGLWLASLAYTGLRSLVSIRDAKQWQPGMRTVVQDGISTVAVPTSIVWIMNWLQNKLYGSMKMNDTLKSVIRPFISIASSALGVKFIDPYSIKASDKICKKFLGNNTPKAAEKPEEEPPIETMIPE